MERKVLGRGLDALIPRSSEPDGDEDFKYLNVNQLHHGKYQPREMYNTDTLKDIVASVREKGMLQPIVVRRAAQGYEVVAGGRRFEAAKHLKLKEIPAVIRKLSDQEALQFSIIENVQRENLNPIEEAHAYQRLIEEFGLTQAQVAQSVSKDRTSIANSLRLLTLPREVQAALRDGKLTMGHARSLAGLSNTKEMLNLMDVIVRQQLTVREAEQKTRSKKKIKKGTSVQNPYLVSLVEELQRYLGTKVSIVHHRKRGKIIIEYYSLQDLDRIIDKWRDVKG